MDVNDPILDGLNDAQHAAVTYGDGPLLVLAGPGSGKTRMLTHRAAHLCAVRHVPRDRILLMTFSNRARSEMQERIETMVPGMKTVCSTVHAWCYRMLKQIGPEKFGFPPRVRVLAEDDDVEKYLKYAIEALRIKGWKPDVAETKLSLKDLREAMAVARELDQPPEVLIQGDACRAYAKAVTDEYLDQCRADGMIDFGLMQSLVVGRIGSDPILRMTVQETYDYILVDEYQDTSPVQDRLFGMLAERHRNITVVGDLDQAIYAFRGALPVHIRGFGPTWNAHEIHLDINYRSTRNIVSAAMTGIRHDPDRLPISVRANTEEAGPSPALVRFGDERAEMEFVRDVVRHYRTSGLRLRDISVMCRAKRILPQIERMLVRYEVPNILYGGQSFYGRREVADVLAWLRLVTGEYVWMDFVRAATCMPRGIGPKTIEFVREEAQTNPLEYCSLAERPDGITRKAWAGLQQMVDLIEDLRSDQDRKDPAGGLHEDQLVDRIISATGYGKHLRDKATKENAKTSDIERPEHVRELGIEYAAYVVQHENDDPNPAVGFLEHLDEVLIDKPRRGEDDNVDAVHICTVHGAKGREYEVVVIIGAEEEIMPPRKWTSNKPKAFEKPSGGIPEERRIFYVAVTRAKRHLYLTTTDFRPAYANRRGADVSRFAREIGGHLRIYEGPTPEVVRVVLGG